MLQLAFVASSKRYSRRSTASSSSACVPLAAGSVTRSQKGGSGIDLPVFIDGGRFTCEDSLAAHVHQRHRLKCAFHANCFKSRIVGRCFSDPALPAIRSRKPSGCLSLARSVTGDQAGTFEVSADRRHAAELWLATLATSSQHVDPLPSHIEPLSSHRRASLSNRHRITRQTATSETL